MAALIREPKLRCFSSRKTEHAVASLVPVGSESSFGFRMQRYNIAPVLIETFVETPRYTGAVYRASGWTHVGTTRGRGRYDRGKQFGKPRKDVWLRPLRKDWQRTLNR